MHALILSLLAFSLAAADLAVAPVSLAGLVVVAGRPAVVQLRTAPGSVLGWRVSDWDGRDQAAGTASADPAGIVDVALTLPAGWHELRTGDGSRFGIVAQDPALEGVPDPYFAIDAALLEFPFDAARRADLIGQLARLGFTSVRERLKWQGLHPEPGPLPPTAGRNRDDELHRLYGQAGLAVLRVFHDTPAWIGRLGGVLPADLADTADAWRQLAQRFDGSGSAIEVWNEPDSPDYTGDATPDQLAALTRAVAWGARRGDPGVGIACGALTDHADPDFRAACWANGLLQPADVFTFHDYTPPERCEALVTTLRRELAAAAGGAGMAMWITESGMSWPGKQGPRPEAADDTRSALAIAMRASEARACGVARHYAFLYPNYSEGPANYGLTGRDGSALRSLAAYSHLARRLAGLAYAGDLAIPGARRARLFTGGARSVAVVWLGDPGPGHRLQAGLPVTACVGLDGRALQGDADGWPVPDGACLVELAASARQLADPRTPAMALRELALVPRPRPLLSPVVVQLMPSADGATPCRDRHIVAISNGEARLLVRVSNLGSEKRLVRLTLQPDDVGSVLDPAVQTVAVAGPGWEELTWRVRLERTGTWRIAVEDDGRLQPAVVVRLEPAVDGPALLARLPAARRHALGPQAMLGFDGNAIAGTRLVPEVLPDGTFSLGCTFPPSRPPVHRRWACPRLELPAGVRFDAVLARMRLQERSHVALYIFERGGRGNIAWTTPEPILPADGQWHWTLVRLTGLVNPAHVESDPSGRLEVEAIDRLGIGFGVRRGDVNRLDISDLVLVQLAEPVAPP